MTDGRSMSIDEQELAELIRVAIAGALREAEARALARWTTNASLGPEGQST
jgi:hypothetical protein